MQDRVVHLYSTLIRAVLYYRSGTHTKQNTHRTA